MPTKNIAVTPIKNDVPDCVKGTRAERALYYASVTVLLLALAAVFVFV